MASSTCRACAWTGRLCPKHEPVDCTCEEPEPGTGWWHEHECQRCYRLVPEAYRWKWSHQP